MDPEEMKPIDLVQCKQIITLYTTTFTALLCISTVHAPINLPMSLNPALVNVSVSVTAGTIYHFYSV